MAFKTRRQKRYEILAKNGFLMFEAKPLSFVPHNVPYMQTIIRKRRKVQAEAARQDWTDKRYRRYIYSLYRDNEWITLTKTGKKKLDAWALLRQEKDRYKEKHPEYKSPWRTRQKKFQDFLAKMDEAYNKYPRGTAYKSKREEMRR
jgi:hypothetical protein